MPVAAATAPVVPLNERAEPDAESSALPAPVAEEPRSSSAPCASVVSASTGTSIGSAESESIADCASPTSAETGTVASAAETAASMSPVIDSAPVSSTCTVESADDTAESMSAVIVSAPVASTTAVVSALDTASEIAGSTAETSGTMVTAASIADCSESTDDRALPMSSSRSAESASAIEHHCPEPLLARPWRRCPQVVGHDTGL
jgi:hypothetical protein